MRAASASPHPRAAPVAAAVALTCSTPPAPVGEDAVRNIGQLSLLDLASRPEMASTADPNGANDDGTHPIGVLPDGGYSLIDTPGPGVLTTLRNEWAAGGPYNLDVDGTTTSLVPGDFGQTGVKGGYDAYPISVNHVEDQGSSVLQAGIGFTRSLVYSSTGLDRYFYALFDREPVGTAVPAPQAPGAGSDVATYLADSARVQLPGPKALHVTSGAHLSVGAGGTVGLTTLANTTGAVGAQIRELRFTVPLAQLATLGETRLQIAWDGASTPAVDAPLKYLAGDGGGVDVAPGGAPTVSSYLSSITTTGGVATYSLYWPMPFQASAAISLAAPPAPLSGLTWTAGTQAFNYPTCGWAPFHATDTRVPTPTAGQNLHFLDTTGTGKIVGTVLNFNDVPGQPIDWHDAQNTAVLEGDLHVTLDGANGPQINTPGTEEWAFGGDYWNLGHPTDTPLAGMPTPYTPPPGGEADGAAEYRWLVPDAIGFTSGASVQWEHGGGDGAQLPEQATVLWYGNPTPDGTVSDTFDPGDTTTDATGDTAHAYSGATTTSNVTGGWWYPVNQTPHTYPVATGTTPTTFTMAVTPGSTGAYLRRTLDTATANQTAEVSVDGTDVGTWHKPGGYNSTDANGVARVFLDDELPLPATVITGRTTITVTIRPARGTTWSVAQYQLHSISPNPQTPPAA